MSERYLKKIITTLYLEYHTQEDFLEQFNSNFNAKVLVVGTTEVTTTEKEHFHTYIEFARQVRFSSIKSIFPTIHLETIRGTPLQNYEYVTKEGIYFTNIAKEDLEIVQKEKEEQNDICEAVIEDILDNGLTLYEILKKYPKFAFYNFKTIQEIKNISLHIDKQNTK